MMRIGNSLYRGAAKRVAVSLLAVFLLAVPMAADGHAKAEEGSPLPQFSGVDLEGNTIDSSSIGQKLLLLEFWSIYCTSCIQEMPYLVELYNKFKDQGMVALSINLDVMQAKRVPKFMKKNLDFTVPYPTIVDDKRRTIAKTLGVGILPTTILVDPQGIVRLFHIGFKPGFEKELEEVIKEHLPAP